MVFFTTLGEKKKTIWPCLLTALGHLMGDGDDLKKKTYGSVFADQTIVFKCISGNSLKTELDRAARACEFGKRTRRVLV